MVVSSFLGRLGHGVMACSSGILMSLSAVAAFARSWSPLPANLAHTNSLGLSVLGSRNSQLWCNAASKAAKRFSSSTARQNRRWPNAGRKLQRRKKLFTSSWMTALLAVPRLVLKWSIEFGNVETAYNTGGKIACMNRKRDLKRGERGRDILGVQGKCKGSDTSKAH